MASKNGQSKMNIFVPTWSWTDDKTPVIIDAGILIMTDDQWESLSDDSKAKFRPLNMGNGVICRGLNAGQFLLLKLD